jgi:hypothetical protein
MIRLFAADVELWCAIAELVSVLAGAYFLLRLRSEISCGDRSISGFVLGQSYGIRQLLRMHKSLFQNSWTRRLFCISFGIWLLGSIGIVAIAADDHYQRIKTPHSISPGR